MLAVARSRVAAQGISNVTLVHGDAQAHRLAAQHFDLVISRFGVMFFADPVAAFTNLIGALRPGGRLCFVCWASLDENPYWKIPLDVVIARLGPPAPKPPHAPGPMAFSDVGYVRGILERAGFEQVAIKQESIALIGTNPGEEARYACIMGPSANLLEEREASDAMREVIAEEMATAFASFVSERGMLMPATIYVVTAFRPH
jgi:SAM-dependent methyltransferase